MDTAKMIQEIKSTCAGLEKKKAELLGRVKEIDELLSYYNTAIGGLEKTVSPNEEQPKCTGGRKPVMLEYNGVTQSMNAWAKQLGISHTAIRWRIAKGWPINKVLSSTRQDPVGKAKPKKVFAYDSHGNIIRQYVGIGEASRSLNMPESTIKKIIENMSKDDQLRVRSYYLAYVA